MGFFLDQATFSFSHNFMNSCFSLKFAKLLSQSVLFRSFEPEFMSFLQLLDIHFSCRLAIPSFSNVIPILTVCSRNILHICIEFLSFLYILSIDMFVEFSSCWNVLFCLYCWVLFKHLLNLISKANIFCLFLSVVLLVFSAAVGFFNCFILLCPRNFFLILLHVPIVSLFGLLVSFPVQLLRLFFYFSYFVVSQVCLWLPLIRRKWILSVKWPY